MFKYFKIFLCWFVLYFVIANFIMIHPSVYAVHMIKLDFDGVDKALLEKGKTIYKTTCIACHGENGRGVIPGMPDFKNKSNKTSLHKTDEVLLKNIMNGYQSQGSLLAMPPKGGNPDLTKDDVNSVLTYIRVTFNPK